MSSSEMFYAPSPKDGLGRMWEAISQLGTHDPIAFAVVDKVDNEKYRAGTEGYNQLLKHYRETYPDG